MLTLYYWDFLHCPVLAWSIHREWKWKEEGRKRSELLQPTANRMLQLHWIEGRKEERPAGIAVTAALAAGAADREYSSSSLQTASHADL